MTSYTFSLKGLPGGLELTGTVETEKELFRQVHFWQGLPAYCPIDGTATVLAFKEPDDFQYYSLQSTGWPVFEYKLGQHKTKGTLFPKGQWTHYDGNSEIVVWENGRYTPAGVKFRQADATGTIPATSQTMPTPSPLPGMCAECRAPEGKPHANSCSKFVKPKAEEVDFRGPAQTGASEEFNAIPSVPTGQPSSAHTATQSKQAAQAQSTQPVAPPTNGQPASRNKMHSILGQIDGGIADKDGFRHFLVGKWSNGELSTTTELDEGDVVTFVEWLEQLKKNRLTDYKLSELRAAFQPA